ncbi:ArnT family glycosyltransferase [Streptomyces litchfieldiae]|uniref:Glycosyltransferase family 39 protein n=1 Tax=Streptomyces litchfieldiae TaxID=3075543 RepID=A0ABU2MSS3_9ACTN|nr:glycosyltransferase family 39 protein [Streptomyces sp. DSM 44938]MDT0344442.1 glycosyltransferase family 39 protein [Streptomyces sp. DSM 44938]
MTTASAHAPAAAARLGTAWPSRLWRGQPGDPRWARPALLAVLALTGALYVWNLSASGWANAYYSAAVQAGTESWKAFLFGSSDAGNSITVDKTPASLWVMALSARIFGLGSWSLLVPQALMGVATAAVLYAAVRPRFGPAAGLVAAAVFALTPASALMFRYNNPDALLVLLMTVAAYAVLRAVADGRTGWLVLAGSCVGFGFLTKMLQAFLVLPALALVYLVCAPTGLYRRIGQLLLGGLALVVSGGWWVALVELWPENSRPYIGGSQENSILELTFGYNGLGRLNGEEEGSVGGMVIMGPNGEVTQSGWGETGIGRLFSAGLGGHIAWLLPASLILLAAGLWFSRRRPRTSATRAAFLLWGTWLLTHWLVFSHMRGIFHEYYTVALAPGIAAVVGMGATVLWRRRRRPLAAVTLAAATALTAWWSYVLLGRAEDWHPWLRYVVLAAGCVAALGLLVPVRPRRAGTRRPGPRVAVVVGGAALVTALAGPAAFALETAASAAEGSIPLAGPATGFGPGGGAGPLHLGYGPGAPGGRGAPGGPGQGERGEPGLQVLGPGAPGENGAGGLLNSSKPSAELTAALERDSDDYTWVAAVVGSQGASGYQLATGEPVMPIGGFNGSDPSPTLEEFRRLVDSGRVHYFIGTDSPMGLGPGGDEDSEAARITDWVTANFPATTIDGITLYDVGSVA